MTRMAGKSRTLERPTGASTLPLPELPSPARPLEQDVQAMHGETLRRTVTITNPHGFHMRPLTSFVEATRSIQSQVAVIRGDQRVDGRRPFELMLLNAECGTELTLEVSGADAAEALEVLASILAAPEAPLPKKG